MQQIVVHNHPSLYVCPPITNIRYNNIFITYTIFASTYNLYMSQHEPIPALNKTSTADLVTMKKFILSQIGGVTEEQLSVMSLQQITNFYNELTNQQPPLPKSDNQTPKHTNQSQASTSAQHNTQQNKAEHTQSTHKQRQSQRCKLVAPECSDQIIIDGLHYYKSKVPQQINYKLENNRIKLAYGPEIADISHKRNAIIQCYNGSMMQSIKSMKDKQIEDTYQRFRFNQTITNFFISLPQQLTQKQFHIYVPKQNVQANVTFLQKNDQRATNVNNQQKAPQLQNSKQISRIQQQQQKDIIQDQFFDELQPKTPAQNKKSIQNLDQITKQQRPKHTSSLKQTFQSAKIKERKQNSVQTQFIKNTIRKTKTQLTVIRQVEYAQQLNQSESQRELQRTTRPSDQQQTLMNIQRKINIQQLKRDLVNPGQEPKKQVLDWILNLKKLVKQFQQSYLSQFKNNWTLIND